MLPIKKHYHVNMHTLYNEAAYACSSRVDCTEDHSIFLQIRSDEKTEGKMCERGVDL